MLWQPRGLVQPSPYWRRGQGAAAGATFTAGASVAVQNNGFGAGTITFSNLNGGVNFPAGAVVIVGIGQDQASTTPTSPQIGGNAATLVTGSEEASKFVALYQATMGGAATDNFTFTNGGSFGRVGVVGGYFTGLGSSVVSAAGTETYGSQGNPQPLNAAITVPASGFGIIVAWIGLAGGALSGTTWTGTTAGGGDVATLNSPSNGYGILLAHTATAGSWNPTLSVTNSGFGMGMSAGTWA